MRKRICILVGMHFRPPAKAVLAHLPAGAQVDLVPEPDNPYDEFAVKVLVSPSEVPVEEYSTLEFDMAASGHDLHEFLGEGPFHLGYIASKPGKKGPHPSITYAPILQPELAQAEDYKAELSFDLTGDPIILVTLLDSDPS